MGNVFDDRRVHFSAPAPSSLSHDLIPSARSGLVKSSRKFLDLFPFLQKGLEARGADKELPLGGLRTSWNTAVLQFPRGSLGGGGNVSQRPSPLTQLAALNRSRVWEATEDLRRAGHLLELQEGSGELPEFLVHRERQGMIALRRCKRSFVTGPQASSKSDSPGLCNRHPQPGWVGKLKSVKWQSEDELILLNYTIYLTCCCP